MNTKIGRITYPAHNPHIYKQYSRLIGPIDYHEWQSIVTNQLITPAAIDCHSN